MPFANNAGVRIHYELEGQGPPLLLAHGFADSLETWRAYGFVEPLATDYQLILLDQRGHGQSDKPHDPAAYRPQLLVGDVLAVLDDLGLAQAHYLGYSAGAGLGFYLAMMGALPHFRSLILGGADPYAMLIPRDEQNNPFVRGMGQAVRQGMESMVAFFEASGQVMPPDERARLLANDHEALVAYLQGLGPVPGLMPIRAEDFLGGMALPCLVYAGDVDERFAGAQAGAAHMPNATFVALPGLNHLQVYSRADLVVPIVKRFLAASA